MKKVTIIVPCYNVEQYIDDCINSIKRQTIGMEHLEVIMVNDASTDASFDHILAFEKEYPESVLAVDLKENVMQGGARNIALSYASGEYITFLDSDDWVEDDFYEELYQIAKKYDTDLIQFPFRKVMLSADKTFMKDEIVHHAKYSGFFEIDSDDKRKEFLSGRLINCGSQSKFYKGDLIRREKPEFLPKVAYEEPSFVYPLLFQVERIFCYDKPKYYYRIRRGSTMQSYVTQKGKMYDHPYVQLTIYERMRRNQTIYCRFKEEIDYYFLFSFWVETVWFAKTGGLHFDFDFLKIMQQSIKKLLPQWHNNGYIHTIQNKDIERIIREGMIVDDEQKMKDYLDGLELHS